MCLDSCPHPNRNPFRVSSSSFLHRVGPTLALQTTVCRRQHLQQHHFEMQLGQVYGDVVPHHGNRHPNLFRAGRRRQIIGERRELDTQQELQNVLPGILTYSCNCESAAVSIALAIITSQLLLWSPCLEASTPGGSVSCLVRHFCPSKCIAFGDGDGPETGRGHVRYLYDF